ncbi:MAG: hypothetical protein AWU54_1196 [Candidatus Frackibacter sp. T328-2]|jgi:hypothetical protein|nr:MAG: hypothetical protein AWU54_1196 [Candidatus Frackibacter sp. T328-2]
MPESIDAKRVINGTYGEVWLNDDKVAEAKGLEATIEINKEDINLPRQLGTDQKMTGWNGTGTLRLNKVFTRIGKALTEQLKRGKDARFVIVSKLKDPDSYGAERVAIKGVSFDSLTLANWETGSITESEESFTFTDFDYIDEIDF